MNNTPTINNPPEIDLTQALQDFEEWKKSNKIINNDNVAVGGMSFSSSVSNQKIPELINQHSTLAHSLSDKSHLQGSEGKKHGAAAERIEVHNQNINAIKNNKAPNAELSSNGIDQTTDLYIDGKPYQMKFYRNAAETLNAIADEKYTDVGKIVPKEQFEDIIKLAKNRQEQALKNAEKCKLAGDTEGYEKYLKKAKIYKNVIETTKPSTISRKQSQFEINHPKLAETTRVVKDIGEAGINAAIPAAIIATVITGATSFYQVAKGDIEATDALIQTGKASISSAATAFGVGASGAAISAITSKAAEKTTEEAVKNALKSFAGSSAPTYVALAVIETSKSVWRYSQGKITAGELAIELGEKAICTVVSAVVGAIAAPTGPVFSTILSTATYMATSAMYRGVADAIRWAKYASEVEKLLPLLEELHQSLILQRNALEAFLEEQTTIRKTVIEESFSLLQQSLSVNSIEDFSISLTSILMVYGKELSFKNLEEFEEFMLNDETVLTI